MRPLTPTPTMPADAMQALQTLAQRLGRPPSLEELYMFVGVTPSGTPQPEHPPGPVQDQDERMDGRLTARLRMAEMLAHNPQLRVLREDLIRRLLFGMPDERHSLSGRLGGSEGSHPGSSPGLDVEIAGGGLTFTRHP